MDLSLPRKALSVTAVTKSFNPRSKNPVHAVKNISFTVEPGEVIGLIGPNGAGKTTLLRILLGFLETDSGAVSIFGEHPESIQARSLLGYQADSQFRSKSITVNRFFDLHRALIGDDASSEQLENLLEHFSLTDARRRGLSTMSKGMRQKIELVQAFLGSPKIVFLDEPTAALDPPSVFELRELLEHRKQQGTTIFFSSHNLTEVEHVCDRVLFIIKGEITAEFSMKNVEPGYLEEMFRVHIVEKKKL